MGEKTICGVSYLSEFIHLYIFNTSVALQVTFAHLSQKEKNIKQVICAPLVIAGFTFC